MATLVLPAPVGAQMSMFSPLNSAESHTALWMRFSEVMPCVCGGGAQVGRVTGGKDLLLQ